MKGGKGILWGRQHRHGRGVEGPIVKENHEENEKSRLEGVFIGRGEGNRDQSEKETAQGKRGKRNFDTVLLCVQLWVNAGVLICPLRMRAR